MGDGINTNIFAFIRETYGYLELLLPISQLQIGELAGNLPTCLPHQKCLLPIRQFDTEALVGI